MTFVEFGYGDTPTVRPPNKPTGSRLGEVADTAAEDDVADGLEDALSALGDATASEPEPVGVVGLLRAMRDPEVRAGLGVAIAMLRGLGQAAGDAR